MHLADELLVKIAEYVFSGSNQTLFVSKDSRGKWKYEPLSHPNTYRCGIGLLYADEWELERAIIGLSDAIDRNVQLIVRIVSSQARNNLPGTLAERFLTLNTFEFRTARVFEEWLVWLRPARCFFLQSVAIHVGSGDTRTSLDNAFQLLGESRRLDNIRIMLNEHFRLIPAQREDPASIPWFRYLEGFRGLKNISVFDDRFGDQGFQAALFLSATQYLKGYALLPKGSAEEPAFRRELARGKKARSEKQFEKMSSVEQERLLNEAGEKTNEFPTKQSAAKRLATIEAWMFRNPCDRTVFGIPRMPKLPSPKHHNENEDQLTVKWVKQHDEDGERNDSGGGHDNGKGNDHGGGNDNGEGSRYGNGEGSNNPGTGGHSIFGSGAG